MATLKPISLKIAKLQPNEKHLHSFFGSVCKWEAKKKYLLFGETQGYYPTPNGGHFYRGHITDKRVILEVPDIPNLVISAALQTIGMFSGVRVFDFLGNFADAHYESATEIAEQLGEKGYVEFPFQNAYACYSYKKEIEDVLDETFFWFLPKRKPYGPGIAFQPFFPRKDGGAPKSSGHEDAARDFAKAISSFVSVKDLKEIPPRATYTSSMPIQSVYVDASVQNKDEEFEDPFTDDTFFADLCEKWSHIYPLLNHSVAKRLDEFLLQLAIYNATRIGMSDERFQALRFLLAYSMRCMYVLGLEYASAQDKVIETNPIEFPQKYKKAAKSYLNDNIVSILTMLFKTAELDAAEVFSDYLKDNESSIKPKKVIKRFIMDMAFQTFKSALVFAQEDGLK